MSIEKKSLISTLKTTKKANAVSSDLAKPTNVTSKMMRREAGLKRADAGLKRADAGLKRADAGLKRADAGLKRRR
jgi:hypothetical protein